MKILVTGANGYLGQGIVKKLLDKNIEVIAADIGCENIDKRAIKKECNIFSIENVYNYFEKPDVLLHLAWRNGFIHNDISHIDDFPIHYKFISDFVNSGVKKVAVMGTMHEVGFFEGSIKDDTPTNPESLYGISKNALRLATKLICKNKNIKYQWLRGFYIVGNGDFGSSIFSKITRAEKNNEKLFPFTSGLNQWDFLDYNDFCEQVTLAICQDEIDGIINICSGFPQKLSDRVEKYIKDNNYAIKLDYGKFPDRPYDSKAVWGDDTKIKKIVNNYKIKI